MTSLRTAHTLGSVLRTEDVVTDDTTSRTFADLMLPSNLVQGLHHAGFIHPSPIQVGTGLCISKFDNNSVLDFLVGMSSLGNQSWNGPPDSE